MIVNFFLATGHSVSKNNIREPRRELEWHRCKFKAQAIHIKQQGPTMNRDQGYQLPPPPSTPRSLNRQYLGQVTGDHVRVIKTCRSSSSSFVSANYRCSSKVTVKFTINKSIIVSYYYLDTHQTSTEQSGHTDQNGKTYAQHHTQR